MRCFHLLVLALLLPTAFAAEGQRDIFDEAIRYATEGSPTPLLVFNTGHDDPGELSAMVDRELGGYYTALSPAERAPTMAALGALPQGGLLNLSPELEYTAARTMLNNENFVSGVNRALGTVTGNTSFFETPRIHTAHGVGIVAEQIGRNWEITFTDDNAPQYMQDNAFAGVALDIVSLLPVLRAVSLGRTVGRAGVATQAARTESTVAARVGSGSTAGGLDGVGAARVQGSVVEVGSNVLPNNIRRLAEANITNSGETILGHFPGYINKANSRGASYFDVGDVWNGLTDAQRWAANRHFLDRVAARGNQINLSLPKQQIRPGSWLEQETRYLIQEKGYVWVNQWSLKPR